MNTADIDRCGDWDESELEACVQAFVRSERRLPRLLDLLELRARGGARPDVRVVSYLDARRR
jgi:hypothetical protein